MNRIEIIGHIGKDAEIKDFNTNQVINFSVAVSESYTNKEGTKLTNTTWYECAYWTNKTAIANYLKKGGQVFISGKPSARCWQNSNGENVASLGITVKEIRLLGAKNDSGGGVAPSVYTQPTEQKNNQIPSIDEIDDDLPF